MKQLEAVVKEVGGYRFSIMPFPAFKAANISGELAATLSPVFGALAPLFKTALDSEGGAAEGLMNLDVNEAASAMSTCTAISGDKVEGLMKKLLLGGHISVKYEDGSGEHTERLDMDLANELFCGNVQDMFALCFHVIQINYGGFFKRFAAPSGTDGSAGKTRRIL